MAGATLLSVLLLWCGAFASPALLLTGFGLAVAGAGGAAAGALVLGVAVGLPAAVRLTGVAASDGVDTAALTTRIFGPRSGLVAAAVLVAARLLAAVLALLAVGDLAAAFAIRTGAGGASGSAASVVAVLVAGLAALAAVAWSGRATRIVLWALSGVALVLTVLVLVVIAPAAGMPMPGTPPVHAAVIAWASGFAVVGLFLVLTAADVVPTAAGRSRSRGLAAAAVLSGLVGLVVLVLALAVGRGAAVEGDAATALAGVIADATPAAAAAPLAIALLVAALPLLALLIRTAGATAAELIGSGRSARLGAVAAALLVLAVALALLAGGVDATTALVTAGPVLGVPVAVWAGVATAAPLRSTAGRAARSVAAVGSAIAVVVGWLLTDGFGVPGERSPLLGLLHLPVESAVRQSPALGLLIAFVLGMVVALAARIAAAREAAPPASRMRTEQPQPVDSVEG